jgi:hypothetical protein
LSKRGRYVRSSIEPGSIIVAGQRIIVDASKVATLRSEGMLAAGAEVEVKGIVQPDGTLLAQRIKVKAEESKRQTEETNNQHESKGRARIELRIP